MKKLLALLLSFSMILCFAACGNDDEVKDKDKDEDKSESTTVENESTTEEETTEEETTEEETTEEETTEAPEDKTSSIKRGTIDGNVYENKSVGIKFTKPDDWYYYTDEEIAESLKMGAEVMGQSEFELALALQTTMTDMIAMDSMGTSVNVSFINIQKSGSSTITAKDYLEASLYEFNNTDGMTFTQIGEIESIKLGSEKYDKLLLEVETSGISMQMALYAKIEGTHICFITAGTVFSEISDIEAMFS